MSARLRSQLESLRASESTEAPSGGIPRPEAPEAQVALLRGEQEAILARIGVTWDEYLAEHEKIHSTPPSL